MVLTDDGPGVENISQAMENRYSTASQKVSEIGFGAGWNYQISKIIPIV